MCSSAEEFAKREARLLKRVERERLARKEAEHLLENKSLDLFIANKSLQTLNSALEQQVEVRTQELESALQKANQAANAKSEFLAVMSHEIRTPMNAVIGLTDLLLETDTNAQQANYLKTLRTSGHALLSLINDILDFSNIDSGKLKLHETWWDLPTFISEVQQIFELKAHTKSLNFTLIRSQSLPQQVFLDRTRVQQVLFNLLSNALKFTHQGGVTLNVSVPAGKTLRFEVTDTGIGMSETQQKNLFKVFTQADASNTRQYGGTGLGLAISQRLTQLMHGQLSVRSQLGDGSCFCLEIPYQTQAASDAPATQTTATSVESERLPSPTHAPVQRVPATRPDTAPSDTLNSNLKILLVEDNPVNQLLALKFLESLKLHPKKADNGLEALEHIHKENFDIILMDIQMPKMDGIAATKAIRQLTDIKQPRIVAVTANVFKEDQQKCFDAGMDAFLSKPITLARLKTQLITEQQHIAAS